MSVLSILPSYIVWHYSLGLSEFFRNARSALSAVARFFSIGLLLRTLFSPWQRLSEAPGSIFDAENFFGAIAVNTLMRIVGFIIRSATIAIGLSVWILLFIFLIPAAALWIILPIAVPLCIAVSAIALL